MRIAIQTTSRAIERTLLTIIAQSGHHVAADILAADLLIVDRLHPVSAPATHPHCLQLAAHGAGEHTLTCPFGPQSLIQRLTMLGSTHTVRLNAGWSLNLQARMLTHPDAAALLLTEKECALLKHLAASHPTPIAREDLLEQVWGMAGDIDTHTLETHIYRLRAKLEPLTPPPCDIVTRDSAYMLALNEKHR
jgi:DNA-binding response OmpR family regulator